jgi:peptide/nickel transport system permease protein
MLLYLDAQVGNTVGGGKASHLAIEALRVAGGEFCIEDLGADSPSAGDRVWGQLVTVLSSSNNAAADSAPDAVIRLFGILTYAAPIFFVGFLLQFYVAEPLGLPTSGDASPITVFEVPTKTHILLLDAVLSGNGAAVQDVLKHLILPAFTLALLICGVFIRLVRVNMLQTMQTDYVEAAEARGLKRRHVTWRHGFRNALVPVITVIGLQFALLLGGAVLTEATFNWPGLGQKLVLYINNRDYGAVQGIITFFAIAVVLISLLVDIVNALIDPRVRY